MTDVFLSYKRDERAAIEQIAARLRALGLTVWFDASMSAGETFNAEIDREARAANVVLVCWSPAARQSEWVNAEAMIGFEQKTLAACYVAGPDGFSAPTPFNATHVEDLRAWLAAPTETHAGWKSVLRRIGKLCARADLESFGSVIAPANATLANADSWDGENTTSIGSVPKAARNAVPKWLLVAGAAALILLAALGWSRYVPQQHDVPTSHSAQAQVAPEPITAPLRSGETSLAFLLQGRWGDNGDCNRDIVFNADGTFRSYTGGVGRWSLDENIITMSGEGGVFQMQVRALDARTMEITNPDGSVGTSQRC